MDTWLPALLALLPAAAAALVALGSYNRLQRGLQRVEESAANLRGMRSAGGVPPHDVLVAYNAAVRAHNSACRSWPSMWVARAARVSSLPYLPGTDAGWYFVRRGGMPQGPAPLDRLRAMCLDGRLGNDVIVAEAGTDRWQPIEVLLELPPRDP